MSAQKTPRLVVVSNRLPVRLTMDGETIQVKQGAGGLVTAMAPILKDRGGVWIGWPGAVVPDAKRLFRKFSKDFGYLLRPVELDTALVDGFYHGFSNEILWPLFHEFQLPCNFLPHYWDAYMAANRIYAKSVAANSTEEDFVWIHDYHLLPLAGMLRDAGRQRRIGFFLHIPFPPADIFFKLPWRRQLVEAVLAYDLVCFQTLRDRRNFLDVVARLYPRMERSGRGPVVTLTAGEHRLRVGALPISIDYKAFNDLAARETTRAAAEELRQAFDRRFIIFGADRLDYTKGITYRLNALRAVLEQNEDLHGKVSMVQVVVPSREDVPQYQSLKTEIEGLVGKINGTFAKPGWTPVHYVYRNLPREELVAYYRMADMALITPLRDGMNLVAKEYVACRVNNTGVVCLSEFAGTAMEFQHFAVLVNPFDEQGMARAIRQAMDMPLPEQRRRMRRLRGIVRRYDIYWWVNTFLMAAFSRHLDDFPVFQGDLDHVWGEDEGPWMQENDEVPA